MIRSRLVVVPTLLLAAACAPTSLPDAGTSDDAGTTDDAGAPVADAGDDDAGPPPPVDCGPDAGADGGPTDDTDAGTDDAGIHDAGVDDAGVIPPSSCSTTIDSATDGTFVSPCSLPLGVRHVRVEGLRAPRTHASVQLVFGAAAAPADAQADLEAGQLRVLFYGGGTPAPPPLIQGDFGAVNQTLSADAAFLAEPSTVCMDVHEGSAQAPPQVVLWLDGEGGANCEDTTTLTLANAYASERTWDDTNGPIDVSAPVYFRQAAGTGATPVITLVSETALAPDEVTSP